jgi:anhydro-N-acetylmuramic acid kinase
MMRLLAERSCLKIAPVEALGWNGDALEAEGFGYLAVRHVLGLPLSLPTTTGVKAPQTGGEFFSKKA